MIAMLMIGGLYCIWQVSESFDEGDFTTMRIYLFGLVLSIAIIAGEFK